MFKKGDDLKRINRISPAVERRLHCVGIYTYAQLAALSPADIAAATADLSGMSTQRIIQQDWIGQARRLAAGLLSVEQQKQIEISADHQHAATFALQLLLNEDNTVRRSHIIHIESGQETTWGGWKDTQLADFLVRHAGLSIPPATPVDPDSAAKERVPSLVAAPEWAAPVIAKPEHSLPILQQTKSVYPIIASTVTNVKVAPSCPARTAFSGTLHLRELETIPTGAHNHQSCLRYGQPFDIRLTLDLSDVVVPSDIQLSYKVSIFSKALQGHPHQLIGESSGIITSTDKTNVSVKGIVLPKGTYCLEAVVILNPVTAEPAHPISLLASKKSDPLLIF